MCVCVCVSGAYLLTHLQTNLSFWTPLEGAGWLCDTESLFADGTALLLDSQPLCSLLHLLMPITRVHSLQACHQGPVTSFPPTRQGVGNFGDDCHTGSPFLSCMCTSNHIYSYSCFWQQNNCAYSLNRMPPDCHCSLIMTVKARIKDYSHWLLNMRTHTEILYPGSKIRSSLNRIVKGKAV